MNFSNRLVYNILFNKITLIFTGGDITSNTDKQIKKIVKSIQDNELKKIDIGRIRTLNENG
jgi:L-lysine 2,3-aminomutase